MSLLRNGEYVKIPANSLKNLTHYMTNESKIVYRLVVAVLLLLTAALVLIPNRYWVAASKKLVPPEKLAESTRPDPWG
jgi:hypothetical protein